jgi:methionyl-tRNA formyltransferase
MTPARSALTVLFLVSAHNSLSQRAYIAVTERGHDVELAVVDSAPEMEAAVRRHRPDLIVCPMLKKFIPESIWARHRCLVVHQRMTGRARPPMSQEMRAIDWRSDSMDTVLRKIRAAEGHPGVRDEVEGVRFHLSGLTRR